MIKINVFFLRVTYLLRDPLVLYLYWPQDNLSVFDLLEQIEMSKEVELTK